jgi:hypothetical protein
MSPPWAPPTSEDGPTGHSSQHCSDCEQPGHWSSECAALQASRIMRDVGPYLPPIGTEHLTRLYAEPTTPLWELTVTRRNVVTIAEIDDPTKISTDPSTPQWAPVVSRPSILTCLSGCGTDGHEHRAEDDSTDFLTQTMMDRLDRPAKKARTVIPEETTISPAPDISEWGFGAEVAPAPQRGH